ncbi:MAG: MGMT family protein [Spirochaetales bacterium]|nr:MGMT family protein [Spirochaetales bacterium]
MPYQVFTEKAIALIASIPEGRVMTYGGIAAWCGLPREARRVARLLSNLSHKHDLPWHRVVNRLGKISLPESGGYELQKKLLESEGVVFDGSGRISLKRYLWAPDSSC